VGSFLFSLHVMCVYFQPLPLEHRANLMLSWSVFATYGGIISSQGLYLHRITQHSETKDKHPCPKRDSNPQPRVRALKARAALLTQRCSKCELLVCEIKLKSGCTTKQKPPNSWHSLSNCLIPYTRSPTACLDKDRKPLQQGRRLGSGCSTKMKLRN
jgi:hypothetical protein